MLEVCILNPPQIYNNNNKHHNTSHSKYDIPVKWFQVQMRRLNTAVGLQLNPRVRSKYHKQIYVHMYIQGIATMLVHCITTCGYRPMLNEVTTYITPEACLLLFCKARYRENSTESKRQLPRNFS